MRHAKSGNRLGRNQTLRKATIRDLAKATLIHQRVCTTKPMAKEARKLVDRLITLGKRGTLAGRRRAFAILCDHKLVSELFNKVSPRFLSRAGGYTRIISLSYRRGDNAQLAYLELTEKDTVIISKSQSSAVSKAATPVSEQKTNNPVEIMEAGKQEVKKASKNDVNRKSDKKIISGLSGLKRMFRKKSTKKEHKGE